MREIRTLGPAEIEDYLTIYLNAYPAFKTLDDECREEYRQKTKRDMERQEDVDFIGLFEDGTLISTMKIVNFRINLYGTMCPATGLMSLAVHPLHKKQHAALDMVRYFEDDARKKGAAVTVLLPFNMGFYRSLGYGLGAKLDEYHLPTRSLPAAADLSKLRLLEHGDLPDVLACHSRYAEHTHGMIRKFSEEIYDMEQDTATRRIGFYREGKLDAYAAYHFVSTSDVNYTMNEIVVDELIYQEPEELRALLGYFRNQSDEAETIRIRTGDAEFYHVLRDPQDLTGNYIPFGYLETNVSAIGNMYKVVDPERFVRMTSGREFSFHLPAGPCGRAASEEDGLIVRFDYEDEIAKREDAVSVRFGMDRYGDPAWSVAEEGEEANVTVRLKKAELSSLFMNSASLRSLIALGQAEISDPAYVGLLDSMLYYWQRPYSNTDF
ncbi:MAG: GNAT family N-acetyltransferase [Anaerovoracaceae bacterium]|jgi:predicted acetyltransferase